MVLIPSQSLFLIAACLVSPDAELNGFLKPPIHCGGTFFIGLGAVLPTFSRNRGQTQWLLLKPSGQVSVRTGIKFVSVDLPSSPGCLGTGFRFSRADPPASVSITTALLHYPGATVTIPPGVPLQCRTDPKRTKQILAQAASK